MSQSNSTTFDYFHTKFKCGKHVSVSNGSDKTIVRLHLVVHEAWQRVNINFRFATHEKWIRLNFEISL